jgi:hypothetical protein
MSSLLQLILFIYINFPPTRELSATIQASEARSEGEHVGLRTTIALDSGSSIHIFKDAFLLTDIHSDVKRSVGVFASLIPILESKKLVNYVMISTYCLSLPKDTIFIPTV